jgi:hypothetical protein
MRPFDGSALDLSHLLSFSFIWKVLQGVNPRFL